jgi:hypothetical protein
MGLYDTLGSTQIKIFQSFCQYKIGDKVPYEDGIYIGFEGFVVVINKIFVAEFQDAKDKWGNIITPEEIITENNPIVIALKNSIEKEK